MATKLPYGSWPSPISAELLATGGTRLGGPVPVGDQVWWTEGIATEGGRQAIVRTAGPIGPDGTGDATPVTVLPAPFNARSRVHEYGGASWAVVPGPAADDQPLVVFVDFASQRVHAFREGEEPRPLSPIGPEVPSAGGPSLRWADPQAVTLPGGEVEVWWIAEDHTGETIERYVAAIPLDGSAAEDPAAIRRVTPSSRFVAHPRLSPDGTRLAWISWEHPQMPWDGTELHIAPLVGGSAGAGEVVAGSTTESVLQPEWLDDQRLVFLSDASGWWNPWIREDGANRQLLDAQEEFAGPMWMLGTTWYSVLDADRLLVTHGHADDRLSLLRVSTGQLAPLPLDLTSLGSVHLRADGLLTLAGASPTAFLAILAGRLDLEAPALSPLQVLRSSREDAPDPGVLPVPEPITVALPDGGVVHAILFRPRHEGICGSDEARPPFIARVHGGPTSHVPPVLNLSAAYYTSRGIGVVEVNYGGSTGYGRAYRDRLKGQWGVVDVADTVAVMEHLVADGIADPARLGIEGGSAGGWTTLACLTRTSTFSAGVSSFGVAELEAFISDTHDFESRYIDGLVGPYPERRDLYVERAPLNHVDELEVPVLLLQGDEDRIVPPSQSEMFRDALAQKHIPHAYILFEGEQHGFRQAASIIRATEASLSFYGQVFGFSPLGVPVLQLES